jgi:hypothetical protein
MIRAELSSEIILHVMIPPGFEISGSSIYLDIRKLCNSSEISPEQLGAV